MKLKKFSSTKFEFINKSLYFPEKGILAVGDLHLGFESMLIDSGVEIPEFQFKEIMKDLKDIIEMIKFSTNKLRKIVFLGDIKHSFGFNWKDKGKFGLIYDFLRKHFLEENIIFIRGNHDTIDYSYGKMYDFHIDGRIAFVHGHQELPEDVIEEVDTIVMGHLHPSIILSDKQGIKKEHYKCFLKGIYKKKNYFILPSFSGMSEGTPVNEFSYLPKKDFSIVLEKNLKEFEVYIIDDKSKEVLDFGKLRKLLS